MSAWTYRSLDGKAAQKIVPPCLRIPLWKGPSAESVEKHEPASDIDTAVAESLKALDPNRPIREADIVEFQRDVRARSIWRQPVSGVRHMLTVSCSRRWPASI